MLPWKRFVDDTITWILEEKVNHVIEYLQKYHKNIKFTYEFEQNGNIPFLDVLLIRNGNQMDTTVYRKKTDNDVYLNWKSFAPLKWKRGTLRTLLLRAYTNCSCQEYLELEINHIKHVFKDINGYPYWIIEQELEKIRNQNQNSINNNGQSTEPQTDRIKLKETLMLPYRGKKGEKIVKSLVNSIKKIDQNFNTNVVYTGTKLGTCFRVKDKTLKEHKSNLIYEFKCPDNCHASYIGETSRRFAERIKDHCGRDHKSHILKHSLESGHTVEEANFRILNDDARLSNYYVRTTFESLVIKNKRPNLNCQEKSRPLSLFN